MRVDAPETTPYHAGMPARGHAVPEGQSDTFIEPGAMSSDRGTAPRSSRASFVFSQHGTRRLALALLCPLLLGLNTLAPAATNDEALEARLAQLEQAVRAGDAAALRALASDGRVQVELRGYADAQGVYAAGQLQVVLARVFATLETRSFAFDVEAPREREASFFASGTWVHRPRGGGPEARQTLTFALHAERGQWRVVEMRATP